MDQPKDVNGILKPCHMEPVPDNNPEYQAAIKEFQATMGSISFTIVKLERIQNPNEFTKHRAFRDTLSRKYSRAVKEKRVFHGTKEDSMVAICHQGFNRNFAADANGNYFSIPQLILHKHGGV